MNAGHPNEGGGGGEEINFFLGGGGRGRNISFIGRGGSHEAETKCVGGESEP